jgi:hypothetical protein
MIRSTFYEKFCMKGEMTGAQGKILIENGGKEKGGDGWSRGG